jgi:hypothetical protein
MDARPVRLDLTPVALFRAGLGEQRPASVSSSGSGQLSPAAWKRLIVVASMTCGQIR